MKESTKKILAFSCVVVVFGTIAAGAGFAMGGANRSIWVDSHGVHKITEADVSTKNVSLNPAIKSIDINANASNVEVKEGTGNGRAYIKDNSEDSTISYSNGDLTISSSPTLKPGFSIGFNGSFNEWEQNIIVVELPQGVSLDKVKIKASLGDITISDLTSKDLNTKTSAGNITLQDSQVQDASVNSSLGDITLGSITANDLSVTAKAGNVTIDDVKGTKLSASSSAGNVSVSGAITGDVNLSSNAGNVTFSPVSLTTHNYTITSSVGSIKYGGSNQSGGTLTKDNGATAKVSIKAQVGNVTVE